MSILYDLLRTVVADSPGNPKYSVVKKYQVKHKVPTPRGKEQRYVMVNVTRTSLIPTGKYVASECDRARINIARKNGLVA